ncbi:hypothetical protein EC988_000947 [Linderina pennispora]|nr:hypothetical protein EC988_000947 [Linderina pennispora]
MGRSGRNSPTSSRLQTPKQTSLSKFFGPRKQSETAEGAVTRKRAHDSAAQQDGIEQQKPAKRGRSASPTPAAEQDPAADDGPAPPLSLGVVAPLKQMGSSKKSEKDGASKRPIGRPRGSKTKPKGQAAAESEVSGKPNDEQEEPAPSGRPRGRPRGSKNRRSVPEAHSEIRSPEEPVNDPVVVPRRRGRPPKSTSAASEPATAAEASTLPPQENVTSVDGTRRRGRPPKNRSTAASVGVAAASADGTNTGAPRRRGRPPKNGSISAGPAPTASAAPETTTSITSDVPRRRGRPPKNAAADLATVNAPRRRGRPPKNAAAPAQPTVDELLNSHAAQTRRGRSRRSVAQINYAEQIDPSISVPNSGSDDEEDEFTADPETVPSDDDQLSDAISVNNEEKEDLDELEDLGEPDESDAVSTTSTQNSRGRPSTKKPGKPRKPWPAKEAIPKSQMKLRHIKQVTEWDGPKPKDHGPNPTRIDVGFAEPIWMLMRNARMDLSKLGIERSPPKSHLPPFLNDSDDTGASENSALDIRMLNANAQALENGRLRVDMLKAEPLACGTCGWAINAGMSVWSIDWVPVAEGAKPKHDFVAVGGMHGTYKENMKYLNSSKEVMPGPGSIQIWRLNTEESECLLDMALVHNFGRCISLKWCPISMPEDSGGEGLAVRGYLAAIFGDGYLRVCGIPASDALRAAAGVGEGEPVYLHWPASVLETRWVHGIFTSMDWVGSSVVMAGTSSGHLTLWSLAESISVQRRVLGHQWPYIEAQPIADQGPSDELFPMIAAKLHQSAVLSAVPMFDDITCPQQESGFRQIGPRNVQVLTVGNDGRMKQICLAFPLRYTNPLACHPGHPRCLIWLHETASLVMSDPDNILRVISPDISPNGNDPWMLSCLHQPPRDQPPGRALGGRRGDQPVHWNDNYDCSTFLCMKVDGKVLMAQASEFHTYYGAVAEGGDLMVQNYGWLLPAKKIPPLYRRIYRLLWEYDDIDVEMDGDVTGDKETPGISGRLVCVGRQPVQARAHKPGGGAKQVNIFPPQIAVQVCAWSRNRNSSSWIASGGAGGLVRIEDVSP